MSQIEALNASASAQLKGKDAPDMAVKTLSVRVADKHIPRLKRMARLVNTVWNHCNEVTAKAWLDRRDWPHEYEVAKLFNGICKDFQEEGWGELLQNCCYQVAKEHAKCRKQHKKCKLSWRVSDSNKNNYSLGWVPFRDGSVTFADGKLHYGKKLPAVIHVDFLEHGYDLSGYEFRNGTFTEDAQGKWHCNIAVRTPVVQREGSLVIGIDPGRGEVMTLSTGGKLSLTDVQYAGLEEKLAIAQRANKKKQVVKIHAKIKNKRKQAQRDFINLILKLKPAMVVIGHWAPAAQGKTPGAKNARAGSLATLKVMLANKLDEFGIPMFEVNEAYTSKTCSECGSVTEQIGGVENLGVREWTCEHCKVFHDRDVNAAKNIAAVGELLLREALTMREAA